MKRPKMPVLTSPWKIGFFVSLMLVVVSSGVAYYFIRKSEFEGTMPQWTGWSSIVDSITPPNGAVIEFWPLLAIVGLSTLFCYVLITRAVRQYKRFLDSGHDYRNLLSTIREIRDLDDHKNIESLRNHPELRDFLISVREMAAVRKKELDLREEELDSRAVDGDGELQREFRDRLSVECDRLVDAIGAIGGGGFPPSVDLAFPELQEVERALRTSVGNGAGGNVSTEGVSIEGLDMIVQELEAGIETGREIEMHLNGVAANTPVIDTGAIRQEVEGLSAALQDLNQFATKVGELDEEAKAVAINSALKAGSGQGTQSDLIELADEVKDIAAVFGNLSGSWSVLGEAVTGHIQAIEAELSRVIDSMNAQTGAGETVENAASKVSRCVEHLVTILEKVNGASQEQRDYQPEVTSTPPAGPAESDNKFDTNEYGFETIERVRPLFSNDAAAESDDDGFDKQADDDEFDKQADEVVPESSTPGFAEFPSDDADTFEHDDSIVMDEEESMAQEDEQIEHEDEPITVSGIDASGIELEANRIDLPPAGEPEPSAGAVDVEDNVIDLYELGAVDYDPAVHG